MRFTQEIEPYIDSEPFDLMFVSAMYGEQIAPIQSDSFSYLMEPTANWTLHVMYDPFAGRTTATKQKAYQQPCHHEAVVRIHREFKLAFAPAEELLFPVAPSP